MAATNSDRGYGEQEGARHIGVTLAEGRRFTQTEREIVDTLFEHAGLSPEQGRDVWRAWMSYERHAPGTSEADPRRLHILGNMVKAHLKTLQELSVLDPTGPRRLYEDYGIRNFGKYSPQALNRQLNRPETMRGHAVIIDAAEDYMGRSMQAKPKQVAEELRGEDAERPVYYEAAGAEEVRNALNHAQETYGQTQWLLIRAHGSRETLRLGSNSDGRVWTSDVHDSQGEVLIPQGALDAHAEIILLSCGVGESNEGIGAAIAEETGNQVLAPGSSTTGLTRHRGRIVSQKMDGQLERVERHGSASVRLRARRVGSAAMRLARRV
jgi:hypothetical protein